LGLPLERARGVVCQTTLLACEFVVDLRVGWKVAHFG
jgi:hypothetical protein